MALLASPEVLFQNYRRAPLAFRSGHGARLVDVEGKSYLDFLGGIATNVLGQGHPALVGAIKAQAERLLHISNLFTIPEQEEAGRWLIQGVLGTGAGGGVESPWQGPLRVFFCNSGTEANEAAIKLARRWGRAHGDRYEIVSTLGGFHGRTLGSLAATGTEAYRQPFEPLAPGFHFVPYNDLTALDAALNERTCAFLVEPIQGENGVIPSAPGYLEGAARLCRERGALLLFDEIQTGCGRTGQLYAFQHYGVAPDAMSLGKALGGGVPVGALVARAEIADVLRPGDHGTTFGGNPLAMAAVIAVQKTLQGESFLDDARQRAARLRTGLEGLVAQRVGASGVRGVGLLLALELAEGVASSALAERCFELGLLVNAVRPDALRLAPPLILSDAEVDEGVEILGRALRAVTGAPVPATAVTGSKA
jgi:predicted acetylornithine/succinylornithine family transaminase